MSNFEQQSQYAIDPALPSPSYYIDSNSTVDNAALTGSSLSFFAEPSNPQFLPSSNTAYLPSPGDDQAQFAVSGASSRHWYHGERDRIFSSASIVDHGAENDSFETDGNGSFERLLSDLLPDPSWSNWDDRRDGEGEQQSRLGRLLTKEEWLAIGGFTEPSSSAAPGGQSSASKFPPNPQQYPTWPGGFSSSSNHFPPTPQEATNVEWRTQHVFATPQPVHPNPPPMQWMEEPNTFSLPPVPPVPELPPPPSVEPSSQGAALSRSLSKSTNRRSATPSPKKRGRAAPYPTSSFQADIAINESLPFLSSSGDVTAPSTAFSSFPAEPISAINSKMLPADDFITQSLARSTNSSPTKKSHQRKMSANHIPRPRNAFILFRSHAVASQLIPKELGINDHKNISKVIGEFWKGLGDEERKVWERMAEEEKRLHLEKYPDYVYRPKSKEKGVDFKQVSKNLHASVLQKPEEVKLEGMDDEDQQMVARELDEEWVPSGASSRRRLPAKSASSKRASKASVTKAPPRAPLTTAPSTPAPSTPGRMATRTSARVQQQQHQSSTLPPPPDEKSAFIPYSTPGPLPSASKKKEKVSAASRVELTNEQYEAVALGLLQGEEAEEIRARIGQGPTVAPAPTTSSSTMFAPTRHVDRPHPLPAPSPATATTPQSSAFKHSRLARRTSNGGSPNLASFPQISPSHSSPAHSSPSNTPTRMSNNFGYFPDSAAATAASKSATYAGLAVAAPPPQPVFSPTVSSRGLYPASPSSSHFDNSPLLASPSEDRKFSLGRWEIRKPSSRREALAQQYEAEGRARDSSQAFKLAFDEALEESGGAGQSWNIGGEDLFGDPRRGMGIDFGSRQDRGKSK